MGTIGARSVKDEFDNPNAFRPMSCAVCVSCFERRHKGVWTGVCLYGGPYSGYVKVEYSKKAENAND